LNLEKVDHEVIDDELQKAYYWFHFHNKRCQQMPTKYKVLMARGGLTQEDEYLQEKE